MRVVVTGGNGEFGRGVIDALLNRSDAPDVVATVRDPARAGDLAAAGVEVRSGSFDEPELLPAAFTGADTVLINATFFGATPEVRGQRVANAIAAAAEARASRIVVTSWPDLDNCRIPVVQDYVETERRARDAGPAWTILRMGYGLGDALARDVMWARKYDELVAPAQGAVSVPAAVSDLAAAAAEVAAEVGHENTVYELTGPRAVDWNDLAALAGELDDRVLPFRAVTDDEYREYLDERGIPAALADGLLPLYEAFRSGWAAAPSPALAALLGRDPVDSLDAVRGRVRS